MIRYDLQCAEGHRFDSWFRDSGAYDSLAAAGQVTCAVCGSVTVDKAVMAPAVGGPAVAARSARENGQETGQSAGQDPGQAAGPLSAPRHPAEAALRQLREHLSKNADYVGKDFATEARRIHDGEAENRGIWGEATREDAEALKDDGIPVAPLPFVNRTND